MGASSTLTLTQAGTGLTFTVNEADIIYVGRDTLGAQVTYVTETMGQRRILVCSDTPANIASMSKSLISATVSGATVYLNVDRMDNMDSNSTGVYFTYDSEGQHDDLIQTSTSESTFYTSLFEKQGKTVYSWDACNVTNNTISLTAATGDVSSTFTAGKMLTIFGCSTDATNGIYKTTSSTFSGGKTVITLEGNTLPTGTATSGKIYIN